MLNLKNLDLTYFLSSMTELKMFCPPISILPKPHWAISCVCAENLWIFKLSSLNIQKDFEFSNFLSLDKYPCMIGGPHVEINSFAIQFLGTYFIVIGVRNHSGSIIMETAKPWVSQIAKIIADVKPAYGPVHH